MKPENTVAQIIQTLEEAHLWLISIGVDEGLGRLTPGFARLKEIVPALKSNLILKYQSATDLYRHQLTYSELVEFAEAFPTIRKWYACDPKKLVGKLNMIVSGPENLETEDQNTNEARNTMFELALGSRFDAAGLSVSLGEPDLRVTIDGKDILISCKRPLSATGIHTNIIRAREQLSCCLDTASPAAIGIIALSLTRPVLQSGELALGGRSLEEVKARHGKALQAFSDRHCDSINSVADQRIVSAIFHMAIPDVMSTEQGGQWFPVALLHQFKMDRPKSWIPDILELLRIPRV